MSSRPCSSAEQQVAKLYVDIEYVISHTPFLEFLNATETARLTDIRKWPKRVYRSLFYKSLTKFIKELTEDMRKLSQDLRSA